MSLPKLAIKNFVLDRCIFQGGMGVGVSLHPLAGAVAREGGLGIISSAGLRTIVTRRDGKVVDTYTATRIEIEKAKSVACGRPIGINVMCAVVRDYEQTIKAAIDGGVDAIISGAGLPLGLPGIKAPGKTALIPIVSSARALEIICKRWERVGYRPDAVVLEGPMAGGHLGFKPEEVENNEFALEKLLSPVLEVASKCGNFPVIVAGGLYTHEDNLKYLTLGASGGQMATRFLVTEESSASDAYKQAVISAGVDDITVVSYPEKGPASPCGLPFRVLRSSPMYHGHVANCNFGYLLQKGEDGKFAGCKAMPVNQNHDQYVCICGGLVGSAGYAPLTPPLYTVGVNAYRVDRILSVAELMAELCGT
jgi:nitronate monooxygenase